MPINHEVDTELFSICEDILNKNLDLEAWVLAESSDEFQTKNYCGGFDATEGAFTFSYYDENNHEFWFQLTHNAIKQVVDGEITEIEIIKADL